MESITNIENEIVYSLSNNLTDKNYTHLNPDFAQVDILVKRASHDCTDCSHRLKKINICCKTLILPNMAIQLL